MHQSHRVRRGRVCAAASALLVTLVSVLGAVGILPAETPAAAAATTTSTGQRATLSTMTIPDATGSLPPGPASPTEDPTELQADTGEGKRVVFDISDQRVWLVDEGDEVRTTYLASGSLYDNLEPGTYEVYSRSRWAVGIDDSGTMEYFVRFTRGANAAIGFHSIPRRTASSCSRVPSSAPRSHTGASVRRGRTPPRCGASRRSARRSSSPPDGAGRRSVLAGRGRPAATRASPVAVTAAGRAVARLLRG